MKDLTRKELIRSLRWCASGLDWCEERPSNGTPKCCDRILQAAADMLEQDGKTADEMFRELGYRKTLRSVVKPEPGKISYANSVFEIGVTPYEVYKFNHIIREVTSFTPRELPAICKLLDEMDVEE